MEREIPLNHIVHALFTSSFHYTWPKTMLLHWNAATMSSSLASLISVVGNFSKFYNSFSSVVIPVLSNIFVFLMVKFHNFLHNCCTPAPLCPRHYFCFINIYLHNYFARLSFHQLSLETSCWSISTSDLRIICIFGW